MSSMIQRRLTLAKRGIQATWTHMMSSVFHIRLIHHEVSCPWRIVVGFEGDVQTVSYNLSIFLLGSFSSFCDNSCGKLLLVLELPK